MTSRGPTKRHEIGNTNPFNVKCIINSSKANESDGVIHVVVSGEILSPPLTEAKQSFPPESIPTESIPTESIPRVYPDCFKHAHQASITQLDLTISADVTSFPGISSLCFCINDLGVETVSVPTASPAVR